MQKSVFIALFFITSSFLSVYGAGVNVAVDASTKVHPYSRDLAFGTNFIGEWNDYSNYRTNVYRFQQAGTRFLRFPGGSNSNEYHWNGNGYYDTDKIWHDNSSPNVTSFTRGFYNLASHRGSLSKGYGKWAMVTDGDLSTYWLSYPDEPSAQWIYLDIENSSYGGVNVDRIVIDWGTPYASQFRVQYSNANYNGMGTWMYNDTAWTDTSAGFQTGNGAQTDIGITTVTAKYIRVLCTQSSGSHNQYAIEEIKLYYGSSQVTANEADVNQTPSVSSSVALGDNFHEYDTMDFEQFMSLCKSMTPAAEPLITVNYFTGTTQEAADWVYYEKYKGYNIKYWEIGNENAGTWEAGGPSQPEDYARRYIAFYDAMTAVDPTITIAPQFNTINDVCNVTMTAGNNAGASDYYIRVFLQYLKDHGRGDIVRAISVHRYPTWEPASEAAALSQTDLWDSDMPRVKTWVSGLCSNPGTVKYWVTEFNDGIDSAYTNRFYNSLFISSFIMNFLKNGGDQTCFFTAFGTPGPGQSDLTIYSDFGYLEGGSLSGSLIDKRYQPRAEFYALDMLYNDFSAADYYGNTIVSASSGNTALKAYANLRGDRKLSIALVNTDSSNTMTANISITGFSPLSSAETASYDRGYYSWVLNGKQSYAAVDLPPGHSTLSGVSSGFTYDVAPYSIRIITMYDSNQPTLVPSSTPTMLPTATAVATTASSGGVIIDDCEHTGVTNKWGGNWSTYGDTVSSYTAALSGMTCNGLGADGSTCYAQLTGTVAAGSWGFGLNCPLSASWDATDISMYDGVAFYYKGDGASCRMALLQSDLSGSNYGYTLAGTTSWVVYQIPFSSLTQSIWSGTGGAWTGKNVTAVQFQCGSGYPAGGFREIDADFIWLYKNTPTVTITSTATMTVTTTLTATLTPAISATSSETVTLLATSTPTITATPEIIVMTDLNKMYVYPAVFYSKSGNKTICFYNLTLKTRVQIYDLKGELVFDSITDTGAPVCWNVSEPRKNKRISSGIYVYVVTGDNDEKKQGKVAVIK
jgi:hypothetical protein